MSDEFIENFMFLGMLRELPREDFLFQLRQDYRNIINTIANNSLDPSRLERLRRWQIIIRELYLGMTRREIEDDIASSL